MLTDRKDGKSIGLVVRPVQRADLSTVCALANSFNAALGHGNDRYEIRALAECCFGSDAFLQILVAEAVGKVRGYLTYHRGFDPFAAAPMYWMADLFVAEAWRGRSFGRTLLSALSDEAVRHGMQSVWWAVDRDNAAGQRFYKELGAQDFNDSVFLLGREAIDRLAAEHAASVGL